MNTSLQRVSLLLLFLMGGLLATLGQDDYEPDGRSGLAKVITDGQTQDRSIHEVGDEDWVRFTLPAPGGNVVVRTGERSGYAGGDTELWLYGPDSNTALVAYNDDYGHRSWSEITANDLAPGTYYILVRGFMNTRVIPGYTLFLDYTTPDDVYEEDDTSRTAELITNGQTQERVITAGNEDWATFTLPGAGGSVVVRTGERSGYTGGDTELWLFGPGSDSALVAYNDDYGDRGWSEIKADHLAPGIYYILVRAVTNTRLIPGYTLFMEYSLADDSYEPDDTSRSSKPIADGETQDRVITFGDEDWAMFTLPSPGGRVVVRTGARSGFEGGDTELWLYGPNSDTDLVAYNDDYGDKKWSEITADHLTAGKYYILVRGLMNSRSIPGYTLFMDYTLADDLYEEDDTGKSAKPILVDQPQDRVLSPGDEDWATFTLPAPGRKVVVRTGAREGYVGGDTELWLYGPDSDQTLVSYNDDYDGAWSQITAESLTPGTYFIRVRPYGSRRSVPGYRLFLEYPALEPTERPLVISFAPGLLRDDYSGWVGLQFQVGAAPIQVTSLGRVFLAGNAHTHVLRVVRANDLVTVATASWAPTGGMQDEILYVPLDAPVMLEANTDYYLTSEEVTGGDEWYNYTTAVATTSAATVKTPVHSDNGTLWIPFGTPGRYSYGPVSLQYLASGLSPGSSTVQSYSEGWPGIVSALSIKRNVNGGLTATWRALKGYSYQVYSAAALNGPWTLLDEVPGDGAIKSFSPYARTTPQAFFRVDIQAAGTTGDSSSPP